MILTLIEYLQSLYEPYAILTDAKDNATLLKSPELEPYHWRQFNVKVLKKGYNQCILGPVDRLLNK